MRRAFIENKSLFWDSRRLLISFGWFFAAEVVILILLALITPAVSFLPITPGLIARDLLAAFVIAVANFALVPLLLWLRAPLNIFTVGLTTLFVNTALLVLAADFVPDLSLDFDVSHILPSAIFLSFANTIVNGLIALDDDYTYLRLVLQMMRQPESDPDAPKDLDRWGMVLLEIDGLSYERMQMAIENGLMPAAHRLIQHGHCLTRFDCGLPSQTSSSQAGIMYGNNDDIPAFRWYDKRKRRMLVSNNLDDASFINVRHSNGRGLLREGASINNLINGDAARSLLTLSTISNNSPVKTERALDTLTSFWLNPYTFGRTLALCIADFFVEVFQAIRQQVMNVQPRLDRRFPSAYTGLRIITNVFLRDLSIYAVMQEIARGAPVIYTTFVGYDEVAHHAGPDTSDAMNTLKGFDRQVRHVQQTIRYLAPFDYDLFILSDHGQSSGATFRQRYGRTLRQTIDALTGEDVRVGEERPVEAGHSFVHALVGELNAASQSIASQENRRIRRAAMRVTARTLEGVEHREQRRRQRRPGIQGGEDIVVCASGNLAHVYFNSIGEERVSLGAIEVEHPNLVDALVAHEGIGFVVVANDDGDVLVLGKGGARNLSSGAVTGQDPLLPYAVLPGRGVHGVGVGDSDDSPDLRADQLLRLAQFDSAGDLILNSTLYPDGSVAAFEELVGSHGGLGGQQTHAFILHPCAELIAGDGISNSADVYALLEEWKSSRGNHHAAG